MAIEVLENKLAIIPLEDPSMIGSLYVPEQAKQRVDQGIVKYKGPKVKEVFVGAHVLFSGYSGDKIAVEDEGELFIMREDDIVCILNDEEATVVFPLSKILDLLERVEGQMLSSGTSLQETTSLEAKGKTIGRYARLLESKFKDIFYAEGLSF